MPLDRWTPLVYSTPQAPFFPLCLTFTAALFFTNSRAHPCWCIHECTISSFPLQAQEAKRERQWELTVEVYCICRCSDDRLCMIACDFCHEWYCQLEFGWGVRPPEGECPCQKLLLSLRHTSHHDGCQNFRLSATCQDGLSLERTKSADTHHYEYRGKS